MTITGADDNTSVTQMAELSLEFPFVEWGILVSRSSEGKPRFPSRKWCDHLNVEAIHSGWKIAASMHICGAWARSAFSGTLNWHELPSIRQWAARVQVNGTAPESDSSVMEIVQGQRLIFQHPSSAGLLWSARAAGNDASPLFDLSGGKGISPAEWPDPFPGIYCGYAGGIGPDNVAEVVADLSAKCKEPFWIDMEGRVRDSRGNLDMAKVREVLKISASLQSPDSDGGGE